MPYSEQDLKAAVDAVFQQFDTDGNQTLDRQEVTNLINAALKHMKANRQASQQEVDALIKVVDKNGDGKIGKPELLEIFARVANQWLVHHSIKKYILLFFISLFIYV